MIEKFLEYLLVEKRYSAHTITSYKKDLSDFLNFIMKTESEEDLRLITKKPIRNFVVELSESNISKRSINRKLSSLRSFYLFLLKIGEIEVSPMETMDSLKFNPEKQTPFSVEEMDSVQKILMEQGTLLERLLIETLYQTGMRKAELCGLEINNVDFSKKELRLIGKGNKERIVPISDGLLEDFKEFSKQRNPLPEYEKYFFLTDKGEKINERFVYSVVNSYFSLVTTKVKKSPHILRHSFATHILDNGAEISRVKEILGHSSLASTQVYTNANIAQLKKVFNNAHPRAKKK